MDLYELHDAILERGDEYWQRGSFDAGLDYTDLETTTRLILMYKEGLGFYLEHQDEDDTFILCSDRKCAGVAVFYPGTEPYRVPRWCCVSRDVAWDVVEEFCKTGRKLETLDWIRNADLPSV